MLRSQRIPSVPVAQHLVQPNEVHVRLVIRLAPVRDEPRQLAGLQHRRALRAAHAARHARRGVAQRTDAYGVGRFRQRWRTAADSRPCSVSALARFNRAGTDVGAARTQRRKSISASPNLPKAQPRVPSQQAARDNVAACTALDCRAPRPDSRRQSAHAQPRCNRPTARVAQLGVALARVLVPLRSRPHLAPHATRASDGLAAASEPL